MNNNKQHKKPERCMKCGFCLYPCPVYGIDHVETHSPRGRNVLIQRANKLLVSTDDPSYQESLEYCLVCGRCKAVCPAKVSSGDITQAARANLYKNGEGFTAAKNKNREILKNRLSIKRIQNAVSGVKIPLLPLFNQIQRIIKPSAGTSRRGTVVFFPGCVFEFVLTDAAKAMIHSLAAAGFAVVCPENITCCGQEIWTSGDTDTALQMARVNIDAVSECDAIITGCAACGAALKNYTLWLAEDSAYAKKAESFSSKVNDYSEFLVKMNVFPQRASGKKITITWHDPCYSKFSQNIFSEPRTLLESLYNVTFVEMENADACCGEGLSGSARENISAGMLAKKVDAIMQSQAEAVVTSCAGCITALSRGCAQAGSTARVMHIAQIFDL